MIEGLILAIPDILRLVELFIGAIGLFLSFAGVALMGWVSIKVATINAQNHEIHKSVNGNHDAMVAALDEKTTLLETKTARIEQLVRERDKLIDHSIPD